MFLFQFFFHYCIRSAGEEAVVRTCANEHDIVLAILCLHFIHHYLGELVVHVCFDYDGPIVDGVHGVEHGRVAPGEGDYIVREVLGGVESSEGLARTLQGKENDSVAVSSGNTGIKSSNKLAMEKQVLTSSPCQDAGREPDPGRGPTGSSVRPCGRKAPGTLF